MKSRLFDLVKNFGGWTTKRKIVIIAVDDYGNARMASKKAKQILTEKGILDKTSFFDSYDHLETREDILKMARVLGSVKDSNGNHAVLTPYCLTHNIDFEKTIINDFDTLYVESLPDTFQKCEEIDSNAYKHAYSTWKDCANEKIIVPGFHGKLHFNQHLYREGLEGRDDDLIEALRQRSHITTKRYQKYIHNWTAAFSYRMESEFDSFKTDLEEGIACFKQTYGFHPMVFTAPAQQFPYQLDSELINQNFLAFDRPFFAKRDYGNGRFKYHNYRTGQKKEINYIVRNVVFEPKGYYGGTAVKNALYQINAAFTMNKPAVISSHRVNFGSYIEKSIGDHGLDHLKILLDKIVLQYKNVEFMSVNQLVHLIQKEHHHV